jgi:esterase/lipase superfamily enzyme
MEIVLAVGDHDPFLDNNRHLSEVAVAQRGLAFDARLAGAGAQPEILAARWWSCMCEELITL